MGFFLTFFNNVKVTPKLYSDLIIYERHSIAVCPVQFMFIQFLPYQLDRLDGLPDYKQKL
jgi:hypothetical protein